MQNNLHFGKILSSTFQRAFLSLMSGLQDTSCCSYALKQTSAVQDLLLAHIKSSTDL